MWGDLGTTIHRSSENVEQTSSQKRLRKTPRRRTEHWNQEIRRAVLSLFLYLQTAASAALFPAPPLSVACRHVGEIKSWKNDLQQCVHFKEGFTHHILLKKDIFHSQTFGQTCFVSIVVDVWFPPDIFYFRTEINPSN